MKRAIFALTTIAALAIPAVASAQEIPITGPLAGAPSVRKQRLYRQGRFEVAVGPGAELLAEYQRHYMFVGTIQYNIFDWLGLGLFGSFAPSFLTLNTDLTDKVDQQAPRNSRTALNLPARNVQSFDKQTGKMTFMAGLQAQFSPFRGKLALFQKIFVDTDLYLHGGVAAIGVQERAECGDPAPPCASNNAFASASRVAWAPTFGLGLSLYTSDFIKLAIEYRAFPFAWNRGGFDSRGAPPDASVPDNKVTDEDRTFKFNQMISLQIGFHIPSKATISD
jgi:outer membrane beta-barrel protein